MTQALTRTWREKLRPYFLRPRAVQVAALCVRQTEKGTRVLLITSRDSGRWIVPKGWPIDGLDGAESALQEAWEEAGVKKARICREPVGTFAYDKVLDHGARQPVETTVYRIDVKSMADNYPEAGERQRKWLKPKAAANKVREPELRALLKAL